MYQAYSAAGYLSAEWPLGQWDFVDPHAARIYADVVARIAPDENISFDEAEAFFLARLDKWDNATALNAG